MRPDPEALRRLGWVCEVGLALAGMGLWKLWLDEKKAERVDRQIIAGIKANSEKQYPKRPSERTKIRVIQRWLRKQGSR